MKAPDPDAVLTDGHGTPIRGVPWPPTEPAGQPSYGPNPTAQGVRGYRDLDPEEVGLINHLKIMQEQVARVWAAVFVRPGTDRRKANIAKTHFEEGFSALVGSVARPHDPFLAALGALERLAATEASGPSESTQDRNSAQQSQDHRPDEGSRA